ncbi:MAG: CAP domain-containing protein [Paracoccaceae bacterium]
MRAAVLILAFGLAACASERPAEVSPGAEAVLSSGFACPPAPLGRAFEQTLPGAGRHDPVRLDRAILHEVNLARCDRGVAPLVAERSLRHASELHNRDMIRLDFFGHQSPVQERAEVSDRLRLVGVQFRMAAENLLEARFMAYQSGRQYQVIDPVRCEFAYADGTPIRRHTYASMGREAVTRWLDSPGHRRNLLNPDLTRHGAALVANKDKSLCGGAYITQVFSG